MLENQSMNKVIESAGNEIRKQTEEAILEQLNEFVSRGLIKVDLGQMYMVRDPFDTGMKIQIRQGVKLILKDQEYTEKLEAECRDLKHRLETIQKAIGQT